MVGGVRSRSWDESGGFRRSWEELEREREGGIEEVLVVGRRSQGPQVYLDEEEDKKEKRRGF